jgi:hypothetical protein
MNQPQSAASPQQPYETAILRYRRRRPFARISGLYKTQHSPTTTAGEYYKYPLSIEFIKA